MSKQYYVYIMTNRSGTLYIGVTNDLLRRVHEHRSKQVEGFTKRYNLTQLIYYETGADVREAIAREKELKGWRRSKKVALNESLNPKWNDLSDEWFVADVIPSNVIPSRRPEWKRGSSEGAARDLRDSSSPWAPRNDKIG